MRIDEILINIGDSLYFRLLERELSQMTSVLDLGCGARSPLQKIKSHKKYHSVGYDIFKAGIHESEKAKIHDDYIIGDVTKVHTQVKPNSFDAVVALDLIEHLPKNEGTKLLSHIEKIARKKLLL